MSYFLAIDTGASSGRHIVGWTENGALQTKEIYRFPDGVVYYVSICPYSSV